jgi:large subunit ribosomal protein L9
MAKNVELILLQDVENLGLAGEKVTVAAGYARNYLIPRGLADKATPGVLRVLAANKEKIEAKRRDELVAAQATAAKLMEANIEIAMQASDDNQLFGSVTARNIADALAKAGFQIAHTRVVIEETIKSVGEFTVQVKLHHDVIADLKVNVVRA